MSKTFEIEDLEMTSVEASANPLAFALQQAISETFPDSEFVTDVDEILVAIEDDLVWYKSNVPLTK
jgi:outer membrane protein assembly factor BamD (BamD/ComL family)